MQEEEVKNQINVPELYQLDLQQSNIQGDGWRNIDAVFLEEEAKKLNESALINQRWRDTFVKTFFRINIPVNFFSVFTTGILAVQGMRTSGELNWLAVAGIVSSSISTFLNGLNTLYDPRERARNHNTTANKMNSLARKIRRYISIPPDRRPDVNVAYVENILTQEAIDEFGNYVSVDFTTKMK